MIAPTFHVDARKFNRLLNQRAAVFGRSRDVEVKAQSLLLCRELTQRTPPLSGKVIRKIVESRGQQLKNPETGTLKERKIGELAIERDRKRIARKTGLRGADLDREIERRKKNVGQAKSGWQPGFTAAGGRAPAKGGWIGRHGNKYGRGMVTITKNRIEFNAVNSSRWAALGEAPRIVMESIARRERAMANQIKRAVQKTFGRGAGASWA